MLWFFLGTVGFLLALVVLADVGWRKALAIFGVMTGLALGGMVFLEDGQQLLTWIAWPFDFVLR
jgi:hypothetical protein